MAKDKVEKVQVYRELSHMLTGKRPTKVPFGSAYHVVEAAPGCFAVFRQSGADADIVAMVPPAALVAELMRYCEERLAHMADYQLTKKEAAEAVEYWRHTAPPHPMPKSFLWPEDRGRLAFTRLPWRPQAGPCPTWDGLLARMTNAKAFRAWVGSLFDEGSYLQQYVWIRGEGRDGKGCINRFLERIFGPAYCSKQPRERGDKFWAHELIGKRITVFPDCNDQSFVAGGFFKSLTGGDPMGAEAKGVMSFTTRFISKFLILSNERPEISSEMADRRRIIYCELASLATEPEADFEDRLWAEGGAFLGACEGAYLGLANGQRPIPTIDDEISDVIESSEMEYAEAFDFYFDVSSDRCAWLLPVEVQRRLNLFSKVRKSQIAFLNYMERTHGVKKVSTRHADGRVIKVYRGLTGKPIPMHMVRK